MRIYEYRCGSCRKKQSFLVLSPRADFAPSCKFCGSRDLPRLFSPVAVLKSEESWLESLADPSNRGDLDENHPRSVARFMKKMGEAVGEDFGEDIEGMAEEAAREAEGSGTAEGAEAE